MKQAFVHYYRGRETPAICNAACFTHERRDVKTTTPDRYKTARRLCRDYRM